MRLTTGPRVGPRNKIGHTARRHKQLKQVPVEYKQAPKYVVFILFLFSFVFLQCGGRAELDEIGIAYGGC